ncbi:hypothetical protein GW17_00002615 [Ensete ventricosum]|nr:hypothetical protein GW17_00002615 [Ensete ventricosum]
MKIPKGRLPLSLMAVVISAVAFTGLIFTEDLRALTGTSILKLTACCRKDDAVARDNMSVLDDDIVDEDKTGFSAGECSVTEGRWVFNRSQEPLYSHQSCPYLDRQVQCMRNGRPDDSYLYWAWEMDDCALPRFNATVVLEKLRGKRLMFVGDSLQRAQWQSFVCLVQAQIPPEHKSMNRSRSLCVFRAKVVAGVVGRMRVPVTFLNITQLSEHRIDGHTSVYTEFQGKILSEEQKANPLRYADCIHWCLPGVPDTWNQLLYAYL